MSRPPRRRKGGQWTPNSLIHDDRLPPEAVCLLLRIVARRNPDAPAGYRELQGEHIGRQRVLNALAALEEYGYRGRKKFQAPGTNRFITVTVHSLEALAPDEMAAALEAKVRQRKRALTVSHRGQETGARAEQEEDHVTAGHAMRKFPDHGNPDHGNPAHIPTGPNVTSLRSVTTGDSYARARTPEPRDNGDRPRSQMPEAVKAFIEHSPQEPVPIEGAR